MKGRGRGREEGGRQKAEADTQPVCLPILCWEGSYIPQAAGGPQIINEQNGPGAKKSSVAPSGSLKQASHRPSAFQVKALGKKCTLLAHLGCPLKSLKPLPREKAGRSQVISYDDSSLSYQGEN